MVQFTCKYKVGDNDMKNVKVTQTEHASLNPRIKGFLGYIDSKGVEFRFKLADRLQERNLSVRDCAKITGLRIATISNLMNGTKSSINLHHILLLMVCLRISKLEDIVEIHIPNEAKERYDSQAKAWIEKGEKCDELMYISNFWAGFYDDRVEEFIQYLEKGSN